jgi:hypothetical protein
MMSIQRSHKEIARCAVALEQIAHNIQQIARQTLTDAAEFQKLINDQSKAGIQHINEPRKAHLRKESLGRTK